MTKRLPDEEVFRGDSSASGGWYIETVPTREMPPELAAYVRCSSMPLPPAPST